jgi:hypothetical protein
MPIPESQLETWSHQGAITTSKNTYASIRSTLEDSNSPFADKDFKVLLQGSYGNDTNIRADSDVDVAMRLGSIFRSNLQALPPEQQTAYHIAYSNATYTFNEFKQAVIEHLQQAYGHHYVQLGNKSVKVLANSGRLGADVVICYQYRDYKRFISTADESYDEGIIFTASTGSEIVNYPTLHRDNCTAKHQATNSWFKPTVRMFKNMRGRLVDDGLIPNGIAPSYFIEGMLYSVPDTKFGGCYVDTFCECGNWLRGTDLSKLVCANYKKWLFGPDSVQWSQDNCKAFLDALANFWNRW